MTGFAMESEQSCRTRGSSRSMSVFFARIVWVGIWYHTYATLPSYGRESIAKRWQFMLKPIILHPRIRRANARVRSRFGAECFCVIEPRDQQRASMRLCVAAAVTILLDDVPTEGEVS